MKCQKKLLLLLLLTFICWVPFTMVDLPKHKSKKMKIVFKNSKNSKRFKLIIILLESLVISPNQLVIICI